MLVIPISIHAPRTGSDNDAVPQHRARRHFNPRSPHGERPPHTDADAVLLEFQSTLPARGATRRYCRCLCADGISIHAPRTGSDQAAAPRPSRSGHFNPRSPHGERHSGWSWRRRQLPFQSTLPARGATCSLPCSTHRSLNFNPRSPHGERPALVVGDAPPVGISIHAPRTGSDLTHRGRARFRCSFQSTLPARGATCADFHRLLHIVISIHAPRTGSDGMVVCICPPYIHFNPRSPHGERRLLCAHLSAAGCISIHAPRTGSDADAQPDKRRGENFNPRSPHGERRRRIPAPTRRRYFNPRSPHGERPERDVQRRGVRDFNPRSPHGERPRG